MAQNVNPGGAWGAPTGAVDTVKRTADASQDSRKPHRRLAATVVFEGGDGPVGVRLSGRLLWTLCTLVAAGPRGVTPIERPAPRWSDYDFKLRALGLHIETIAEPHGGDYPGHHGRYVLRSVVAIQGGA